jgi:sugar phosphate isomerase/epimerase
LDSWHDLDCLEIQYEHNYLNNWWQSLAEMLKNYKSKIVVHGPTQQRDIASTNQQLRSHSLAENKKALDFAAAIGAENMILHITPKMTLLPDYNSLIER